MSARRRKSWKQTALPCTCPILCMCASLWRSSLYSASRILVSDRHAIDWDEGKQNKHSNSCTKWCGGLVAIDPPFGSHSQQIIPHVRYLPVDHTPDGHWRKWAANDAVPFHSRIVRRWNNHRPEHHHYHSARSLIGNMTLFSFGLTQPVSVLGTPDG